jgi:cytochrome P450
VAINYNPFLPQVKADPYPYYADLRREAPVHQIEGMGVYAISRYDDVMFALNHPELFSSEGFNNMTINDKPAKMLIFTDPPDHTKMRNLVNRGFTPKIVADLEPRIRQITEELIDAVVERGETELIADFAIPLPVTIIAELLGVDPARKEDFKRWSDWIVTDFMGEIPQDVHEAYETDMEEFKTFFDRAVAERQERPTNDLIGVLVRAGDENALSAEEVLAFIVLLLVAGNETTTNLIGNAVIALLAHPHQLKMLRADASLVPNAVEEALRYDAPVQFLFRRAAKKVELSGVTIPEGSMCTVLFGSANRDERRYADSDRFDITRDASGHVAFGHGIHFCLGAPLARLEGRIALEALLRRLPNLRRVDSEVELVPSFFLRGPQRLPLTFTPTGAAVRS